MKYRTQRVSDDMVKAVRNAVRLPSFDECVRALMSVWNETPPEAQQHARDEALRWYGGERIASRMKRYEVAGKTAPKA